MMRQNLALVFIEVSLVGFRSKTAGCFAENHGDSPLKWDIRGYPQNPLVDHNSPHIFTTKLPLNIGGLSTMSGTTSSGGLLQPLAGCHEDPQHGGSLRAWHDAWDTYLGAQLGL